jgi:hypothetical protein
MTKTTEKAIPVAVSILLETPKKGQFPRNWTSRILLTKMAPMTRRINSENVQASFIVLSP